MNPHEVTFIPLPASKARKGDLWKDHGVIRSVVVDYHNTSIWAGTESAPYIVPSQESIWLKQK